ncbi:hypothetical protein, partial [Enterococcus lactis]|uniref:hypothetical protein n=1 Tax=Enterococcus lactis TaxID=357441 RepID=UPI00280E8C92
LAISSRNRVSLDSRSLRSNNASASFIDFILSSKVSFLYLRKKNTKLASICPPKSLEAIIEKIENSKNCLT